MAPRRQQDNLDQVSDTLKPESALRAELRDLLLDRVALFELADRVGVPHRGVRFFSRDLSDPAADLRVFLDQNRGQTLESPWWVSSQDRGVGLDRWSPARELRTRDRESWRMGERFPGGFIIEAALDTARRVRVFWRRPVSSADVRLSELWDISLSEARAGGEVARRRIHLALSPPPGLGGSVEDDVRAQALKLLEVFKAPGEGWFDFFVDGERVFVADGQVDIEPWFAAQAFQDDSAPSRCLGMIHLLDPRTFLPQPGTLVLSIPEDTGGGGWRAPGAEGGAWNESGVVLAIRADGDVFESALTALGRLCEAISAEGSAEVSAPYLRDLACSPWVHGGHFHCNFLEEEFVPSGFPLEAPELSSILEALSDQGTCFSIDGRLFRSAAFERGSADLAQDVSVRLDVLGDRSWLVRTGCISRFVRGIAEPGGRELRAQCAGRVLTIESVAPDFSGGALLVLESGGEWIPHAVSSVLSPRLKWRVGIGDRVHRGQLLARVE